MAVPSEPSLRTTAPKQRAVAGAPAYDSSAYWEARFARVAAAECGEADRRPVTSQDGVEWLGQGQVLLEPVGAILAAYTAADHSGSLPYVLHLGAGVSDVTLDLAKAALQNAVPLQSIINVDFAPSALDVGRRRAAVWLSQHSSRAAASSTPFNMQFGLADLRDWSTLVRCLQDAGVKSDADTPPLRAIVDKSTCDSLATASGITLTGDNAHACPLLPLAPDANRSVAALDLVAVHLAALTQPNGIWVALSYSKDRFDFLLDPSHGALSYPHWTLEQRTAIVAPSGSDNPFAPAIYHHFFLLRRRSTNERRKVCLH